MSIMLRTDKLEKKFGKEIPLIRRQDVSGFVERPPAYSWRPLAAQDVRKRVDIMEAETRQFYDRAVQHVTDAELRKQFGQRVSS